MWRKSALFERMKFWMKGEKDCSGCCLGCSFFRECKSDVIYERDMREAYERDIQVDAVIRERLPEQAIGRYHRKTA